MDTTPAVAAQPGRLEPFTIKTESFSRELDRCLSALDVQAALKRQIELTLDKITNLHFVEPPSFTEHGWLNYSLGELANRLGATAETISRQLRILKKAGYILLKNAGCKGLLLRILKFPERKPRTDDLPSLRSRRFGAPRPQVTRPQAAVNAEATRSKPENPDTAPLTRDLTQEPEPQPSSAPVVEAPVPTPTLPVVELAVTAPAPAPEPVVVLEEAPAAPVLAAESLPAEVERVLEPVLSDVEPKLASAVRERLHERLTNGKEPLKDAMSYAHALKKNLAPLEVELIAERREKRLLAKAREAEKSRAEKERTKTEVIRRQKAVERFDGLSKEERARLEEQALKSLPESFRRIGLGNLMVREEFEKRTFELFLKADRSSSEEPLKSP